MIGSFTSISFVFFLTRGKDYDVGSLNEGFILRFSPFIIKGKSECLKWRASVFMCPSYTGRWRHGDDRGYLECVRFIVLKKANV